MSKIILDFGSGNSCKNDKRIAKGMYDELKKVDTGKHEIVCKWQLFEKAGNNIPLYPDVFEYAYDYGTSLGYPVTSSVFDKNSLDFLLDFDSCFVKIANRKELYSLIGYVPRKNPSICVQ
jgi:sialic acid synthase SpsE